MKRLHLCHLILFVLFASTCHGSQTHSFDFSDGLQGWGVWGEGVGKHNAGLGNTKNGSVELRCNAGQTVTMHQKFHLTKGRYKVTASLRALDVEKGRWDTSIWLFYQTGEKIQSPVKNLLGTFNWSTATYTIDVGERAVNIWFRLKSAGTIWVDDITIVPFSGPPLSFSFEKSSVKFPVPNPIGKGVRCPNCYRWMDKELKYCTICGELLDRSHQKNVQKKEPVKMLLDFEQDDARIEKQRHYLRQFSEGKATSGRRSAIIPFGKFNNLNMKDGTFHDWSGYDFLEMDVYNPVEKPIKFSLAINDQTNGGYWNQLNHYSTLAKGWNTLKFSINRHVGERGSVRIHRYLDLAHIKKFWFMVSSEDKGSPEGTFLVDNIRLTQAPKFSVDSKGIYLFDFVKEGFRTQKGFLGIEARHNYHKDIGFGFVDARIWRSHDSIYADSLYRDGIFINEGGFRVDVPDGHYIVRLVPYGLGEWYEHFWTRRKIKIQGRTVLNQSRRNTGGYIDDFLRFSEVEPKPSDNPYDLYLKDIFQEIVTEVNVKNGRILIECEGDDSAIMLNSLIIYPVERKQDGELLVKELYRMQKDEFGSISRKIDSSSSLSPQEKTVISTKDLKRGFYTALISSDTQLRYNQILKSNGTKIELSGGRLQRPVQALLVRNLQEKDLLTVSVSSLKSEDGKELTVQPDWVRYGVAQYQSHTFNHETYELAPRFLRTFPPDGLVLEKDYSRLLWFQIPLDTGVAPGSYTGTLDLQMHGQQIRYPVKLQVKDFTLPEADIAVGFFGLDPIGFAYFDRPDVKGVKRKNRTAVLKALRQRGFTTWSSLPKSHFQRRGDFWKLKAGETDWLMKEACRLGFTKKVFTYGSKFPVILDKYGDIDKVPQEKYRRRTAAELEKHMTRYNWLPVVFDISDEAAGYSQKVKRDTKRAEMLNRYFPYLRTGGYAHPIAAGEDGSSLNMMFTDISLSSYTKEYVTKIRNNGHRWGLYNQAIGLFENNREAFGEKLIQARKLGCDHFLEWHLTLSQNYPYYDLDGRENDAMMVYPRKDGGLDFGLKFEWASLGLENYRLNLLRRNRPQPEQTQ